MTLRRAAPWVVLVLVLAGFGVYAYRVSRPGAGDDAPSRGAASPSGTGATVYGDRPVPGNCYETRAATDTARDVTPQPAPCDGLHNTVALDEATYPDPVGTPYDEARVLADGRTLCEPGATRFVGASTATFTFLSIAPSAERWASGDRAASCLVRREGPDVVGALTQ